MPTHSTPRSHSHDLTRDEIISRFRDRIAQGKRTKLTKDELGQLILHFIDRLQLIKSAALIQQLCAAEIALLESGYPQSTLASDYIPKYRKAIVDAIASGKIVTNKNNSHRYIHTQRVTGIEEERFEHYALTYFKYDKEVYSSLDKRSADTNRTRQVSLRKVEPNEYLLKLGDLLDAQGKFAARLGAIAIAGLTGRRIGEVLAKGQFQLSNHPHLLRFEGHQKTQVAAYDIVTLIPAVQLLEYIEQFRSSDEIHPLLELESDALTKAINQLDVQINRECVKHLGNIVPPLSARSSISIHNLRSLWGAIAVWLFCPDNQHEYPFIQHYLGHAIDSNATGHYFRYQLVDRDGHPLRDKGVKLPDVGELPLFTDDTTATPRADTSDLTPAQSAPAAPLSEIPASQDAAVDEAVLQPASPTAPSPTIDDTDFFNQIKADNTTPLVVQTIVDEKDSTITLATPPLAPAAATSKIDSKILKLNYYQRDRHRLSQLLDTISPTAGTEQEKIAALLDWAEQHLHSADHSEESQGEDFQPDASDALAPAPASSPDLTPAATPTPESSSTPAPTSISPLELLVTTAVTDQARTLGVLASRVETLEAQVSQLQLERDRAHQQLAQQQAVPTQLTQQLEHLQAENSQLRSQLERFEAIRRAFMGESPPSQSADDTTASSPASTQANSTDTKVSAPVFPTPPVDTISNSAFANPTKSSPLPKSNSSTKANKSLGPSRGAAIARAESIFHALIAWNTQHPDDTFAMTDWLLEGVFNVNRKAAKQFCQDFHDAIRQHHEHIGIDNTRSHNRGRDTSAFKAFVNGFSENA